MMLCEHLIGFVDGTNDTNNACCKLDKVCDIFSMKLDSIRTYVHVYLMDNAQYCVKPKYNSWCFIKQTL